MHLTHAYQKLGISSREQLPAALGETVAPADRHRSAAANAVRGREAIPAAKPPLR